MRAVFLGLMLVAFFTACGDGERLVVPPGFSSATIEVTDGTRSARLEVELAANPAARQQGLMFRRELSDKRGMLFVYPGLTNGGHWMKDTYIPLDIAYADETGVIRQVVQGKPLDRTLLAAQAPFQFVLEVRAGWFADKGFGPGSRLILPADLPAGE